MRNIKHYTVKNVRIITFVMIMVFITAFLGVSNMKAADTVYECESLTTMTSAGATQTDYSDANCSGGYFNYLDGNAVNDYVEYTVNITTTGTYNVKIKNKNYNNRGIYQLSINGTNQGPTVDQYVSGGSATYTQSDLGTVTFSSTGNKLFRFTVVGKNAGSSGYKLGMDCIILSSVSATIIIDNTVAELTGSWTSSAYKPNYYGSNYLYCNSGTGSNKVRWRPNITTAGNYSVYYWLPDGGSDRATNAPFTVYYNGGSHSYYVNEQPVPGGQWIYLGTHNFAAGTSGYVELTDNANGTYVTADAIKFDNGPAPTPTPTPAPGSGNYTLRLDLPKQTIWGLGVEIQSDSIGSGNNGLPTATTSVPHDLVAAERTRFYNDLLKGFRYLRLAGGLYFRGLDAQQQYMQERWPEQCEELREMIQQSGIEGIDWEYWSPAPYWKSNGSYIGGTLKQFDTAFLTDFGNAIIHDINYLQQNVGPVLMFGLQNEPNVGAVAYSCCGYDNNQYYNTFKVVAPMIKNAFPSIFIHNESMSGQNGRGSSLIKGDSALIPLVDAWTWHKIGTDSNDQITSAGTYNSGTAGKYVFNNEFEYLSGGATDWRCINTAQSIMNWFTFENSPTWFWLHALKPTYNSEASGYSLGFWRPWDDDDFTKYSNIQKGYWDYNKKNWHSIAGFLKYMPWNSVRYQVDEESVKYDNRILAWKTPAGKLVIALTNRSAATPFTFNINLQSSKVFNGYRYTPNEANLSLGNLSGSMISPTLPPYSIEFWVEQ